MKHLFRAIGLAVLIGLAVTFLAPVTAQQVINGSRSILGAWDATAGTSVKPFKQGLVASLPGTCATGETYFATDGVPGRKIYTCSATNTWTTVAYAQGTAAPGTCTLGEIFFDTNATAGANLYFCTATDTWTQMTGGGATLTRPSTFDPATTLFMKDEFMIGSTSSATVGDWRWAHAGGTSAAAITSEAGHPGIYRLRANNNQLTMNVSNSTFQSSVAYADTFDMLFIIRPDATWDNADTMLSGWG
jgi:hypothetical protein